MIVTPFSLVFALFVAPAQDCDGRPESQRLVPQDVAAGQRYGEAVACSEFRGVVGAPGDDLVAVDAGAAYLYSRVADRWDTETRVVAPDGAAGQEIGCAVAVSEPWVAIGARHGTGVGSDTGAVYLYVLDIFGGLVFHSKVVASDGAAGDQFGFSLAMDGRSLVVGAPFHDDPVDKAGAAYVYRWTGAQWVEEAKLASGDASPGSDQFGIAVDVDRSWVAVGANLANGSDYDTGAVHVFRREAGLWSHQAKLTSSSEARGDQLGRYVALHGTWLAAGAPKRDSTDVDAGSVFVFQRDDVGNWEERQELVPEESMADDGVGPVAIQKGRIVVGAPRALATTERSGVAYEYLRGSEGRWVLVERLVPADDSIARSLGGAVAITKGASLIGASESDAAGGGPLLSGAAYGHELLDRRVYTVRRDGTGEFDDLQVALDTVPEGSVLEIGGAHSFKIGYLICRSVSLVAGAGGCSVKGGFHGYGESACIDIAAGPAAVVSMRGIEVIGWSPESGEAGRGAHGIWARSLAQLRIVRCEVISGDAPACCAGESPGDSGDAVRFDAGNLITVRRSQLTGRDGSGPTVDCDNPYGSGSSGGSALVVHPKARCFVVGSTLRGGDGGNLTHVVGPDDYCYGQPPTGRTGDGGHGLVGEAFAWRTQFYGGVPGQWYWRDLDWSDSPGVEVGDYGLPVKGKLRWLNAGGAK